MSTSHDVSTIQTTDTITDGGISRVDNAIESGYHAHWDCFSGAAGDMMLAACLDAVDFDTTNGNSTPAVEDSTTATASQTLLQRIEMSIKMGLPDLADEFRIECKRVWRGSGSIAAMHVTVNSIYKHKELPVPQPAELNEGLTVKETSRSHNIPLHSHERQHHHDHSHGHNHATTTSHTHDHDHDHIAGDSSNIHEQSNVMHSPSDLIRNLPEIRRMLMNASEVYIPKCVRDHAIAAFTELAKAEAAVHGAASMNDVHFHEVGAVDSIVDTVGTLLALHFLNVTSVSCSRVPLGEGMVSTAHGVLPVPAPATLRLMTGMPITSGPPGRTGELVTPTAASLLRVLVNRPHNGRPPNMTLRQIGIGAGTKNFANHPNIIRILIGQKIDETRVQQKSPHST